MTCSTFKRAFGIPKPYAVLLVLLLTVALTACGSGSGGALVGGTATAEIAAARAAKVRNLEDILTNGPTFKDLSYNSVTVLIDTSIPVVCAAAYGTTVEYGSLATDSDMVGGAHSNHHPALTGLQPSTEYHLRLQGVGPDGTLYSSKDYTFHTLAAPPGARKPVGPNLALLSNGARVTGVSSNYQGDNASAFGADHAFDGDPASQWSSNGDGNQAWIELELARKTHVTNVGFWTRTMGASAQIHSFRVVADGAKTYGPYTLDDASGIHYFATDFTALRLRFEVVDSSGGNTGAVEIEVYGQQGS